MKQICNKCWNVPCTCGKNHLVEIDDLILDDIIMLNKKGYKTRYCCEGHNTDCMIFDLYVLFDENNIVKNIPQGFKTSRKRNDIHYTKSNIKSSKSTKVITPQEIEYARTAFHEWVLNLPNRTV